MHNYKIIKKLGSGAFGEVQLVQHIQQSKLLALKTMKAKFQPWPYALQIPQIKALMKLKHPNIVALKQIFQVGQQLSMVFQYVEGTLYDNLLAKQQKTKGCITQVIIKKVIQQLAKALNYMHRAGFFHRDLKPQNILYNPDNQESKICDFGLVRQVRSSPPYTQYVSTRWYRAPQLVLRMNSYNSPVDVFALGCIMAELYLGNPIFPGATQSQQLNRIFKVMGTPSSTQWPEMYKWAKNRNIIIPNFEYDGLQKIFPKQMNPLAIDLIRQMLHPCPKNRITSQNILKHQFFKSQNFKKSRIQCELQLQQISNMQQNLNSYNNFQSSTQQICIGCSPILQSNILSNNILNEKCRLSQNSNFLVKGTSNRRQNQFLQPLFGITDNLISNNIEINFEQGKDNLILKQRIQQKHSSIGKIQQKQRHQDSLSKALQTCHKKNNNTRIRLDTILLDPIEVSSKQNNNTVTKLPSTTRQKKSQLHYLGQKKFVGTQLKDELILNQKGLPSQRFQRRLFY